MILFLQRRDDYDIMKLMIDDVKELWTCGDEKLEKFANNIMTALQGKVQKELLGDQTGAVIDKWLIENDVHVLCKNMLVQTLQIGDTPMHCRI